MFTWSDSILRAQSMYPPATGNKILDDRLEEEGREEEEEL